METLNQAREDPSDQKCVCNIPSVMTQADIDIRSDPPEVYSRWIKFSCASGVAPNFNLMILYVQVSRQNIRQAGPNEQGGIGGRLAGYRLRAPDSPSCGFGIFSCKTVNVILRAIKKKTQMLFLGNFYFSLRRHRFERHKWYVGTTANCRLCN